MLTNAHPPCVLVLFESASKLVRYSAHSDISSPSPPSFFLAEDLRNAVLRRYFIGVGQLRYLYRDLAAVGHTADSWSLEAIIFNEAHSAFSVNPSVNLWGGSGTNSKGTQIPTEEPS
ncbi:MAG: hypothetical protein RIF46_02605 [Cyclobacteriaceae bacterium]